MLLDGKQAASSPDNSRSLSSERPLASMQKYVTGGSNLVDKLLQKNLPYPPVYSIILNCNNLIWFPNPIASHLYSDFRSRLY